MVYHDDQLLPSHQYAAYYQWLREEFAADVIIHVGTHGTLEFLPGKESGLSGDCFPDCFIDDVPHLYYYYVGNPSEGMIAKRRSHATLISYQAPPFVEGELYGEYAKLNRIVHEYREAKQLDPERCGHIWAQMKEIAEQSGLSCEHFEQVEDELYRMKRSMIPRGLHVIGQGFSPEDAMKHMAFVLRHDRTEAPALRRLLATAGGMDYDRLLADKDVERLAKLDEAAQQTVETYLRTGEVPEVGSELANDFRKTLAFGERAYEATLKNEEIEGLLQGLRGKYVPVNLSGDVMRNPEILPTGRNMYQLDPRSVPSESAVKRGVEIAQNTVHLYHKQTGKYPHTTALVMWGIETARTQGETVGQILHYLGVKLGSRNNSFQSAFEIIPLEELGRPRLNIVVNISGIFRDMFPNIIDELNALFRRIASLDEPEHNNFFKQQTNKLLHHLLEEGYSSEEASDLACARIFGPAEGEYGTGVTSMIETKNWTDEEQIGDMYNKHLRHVYSSNCRGKETGQLFNANLAAVDIVSQLRSNHEHEVVDIDHYYEYFGGLSKAIESIKGEKAEIYITDTTGEAVLTEDVHDSINRGVRTRMLNPKWIDALLSHPYHGAQQIAQRFENVLGLASTTNKVDHWVFSALHDTYVADEARSKQLEENNRYAYHEILETMLESYQRQYWNPTDEQLEQLQQKYMQLEGEIES
jgi:cobaltochelatase CobN